MTSVDYEKMVTKNPSQTYGLKWIPSLEPYISNDTDWNPPNIQPTGHFSKMNTIELAKAFCSIDSPRLAVEIGVNRSEKTEISSTEVLLAVKPEKCIYIGIDKIFRELPSTSNTYLLQNDSSNRQPLYDLMDKLGYGSIDFMFVDGWHSINQVLSDWGYWENVAERGYGVS